MSEKKSLVIPFNLAILFSMPFFFCNDTAGVLVAENEDVTGVGLGSGLGADRGVVFVGLP